MHTRSHRLVFLATFAAWFPIAALAATENNPVAHEPRLRFAATELHVIVKLTASGAGAVISKMTDAAARTGALGQRTGLAMKLQREISGRMLASSIALGDASDRQVLQKLRADPAIEYVVLDHRRYPQATTPNDPLFDGQWYLKNTEVSAVNATDAWDLDRGSAGVVVAVLDTGALYDHPDLGRGDRGGKLLPGYDFVSQTHQVNDGDGRDSNPSDPGDWIDSTDKVNPLFLNCDEAASSWHGTRVAGMIGALTNNSAGISGITWNSFLLPVRVLGKCGGIDSDILAGMRWAAGLHVPGVADNPTPARILNMSLGATSACEQSYLDVIDELTAHKVLVVISAGNEGTVVSSPANCPGVAAIAAIRHAGSKVGFSNLGTEVTLAAPGGNCVNVNGGPCLFSLDTTSNSGATTPGPHTYTDQVNSNLGTSFSAPIVSGIAALMLSRNANLSTGQLLARLREGAQPFPTAVSDAPTIAACHVPVNDQDFQLEQCLCTTDTCGAGMANAARSLDAADRPIAAVLLPASVSAGQNVSLNASGSAAACNRTVSSYAWTVVSPGVNPPAIVGATTASASVVAPSSGSIVLRVSVTDNLGHLDAADVVIGPTQATSNAPVTAGSTACATAVTSGPTPGNATTAPTPTTGGKKGGGGGSIEALTLMLLGALSLARMLRSRRVHFSRCI
jgi:serine protease